MLFRSLLVATAWNLAGPRPPGQRAAPIQDLLQYNRDELGLDAQTLEQAWAIADDAKADLDGFHQQIREERGRLEALLDQTSVDPAEMSAHVAQIGRLETQLRTRELDTMLLIRALLTSDQVDALRGLRAGPPPTSPPRPQ